MCEKAPCDATRTVFEYCNTVSYGIFLWHLVVTQKLGPFAARDPLLVVFLGTLAISVPSAAASYYLLERPLLRLKYVRLQDLRRRLTSELARPAKQ